MRKSMINKQIFFRGISVVLILMVLFIRVFQLFLPDKEYSEMENRNLQTKPEINLTRILSGRYSSNMETCAADQFPFRTAWVQMKGLADRLMGKTESNHIFLAKKGYLIENFIEADSDVYDVRIKCLEAFAKKQKNLNQYMLIAPTAVDIYRELLPAFAQVGDQDAFLDRLKEDAEKMGITFVDVRKAFRQAEDTQLYYRTDHHWTTDGAYLACSEFARAAALANWGGKDTDEEYERLLITDSFSGTMSASSGFRMWEKEDMYVYIPANSDVQYSVNYVTEARVSASFYETKQLKKRDKYAVFLGGNHPLVKISTTAGTDRVLLILKDSYANCFVPFLTGQYDKILMVDPRYYYDDLENLISSEEVTDLLYLYNANGFAQDTSLVTVLGSEENKVEKN